jgi:hypothetical protein
MNKECRSLCGNDDMMRWYEWECDYNECVYIDQQDVDIIFILYY